jgi:DNA-binding CsgD family transcriptional regulator
MFGFSVRSDQQDSDMNRDQLKAWLEEGLSLSQIGRLVNRDPSTVGYWVQRFGLTANGRAKYAPRGGIQRAELEMLIAEGLTLSQIAERLQRSTSTVVYWMRKFELKTMAHRRHRNAALAALRAGRTRFISTCRRHGQTQFLVFPSGRARCARCNGEAVARRRRKVKQILVAEAGGCCELCGYDRYLGALQFHHVDPSLKSFALSHEGVTRSLTKSREEAGKCVLLCSNCHAEVEAGVTALPAAGKLAT